MYVLRSRKSWRFYCACAERRRELKTAKVKRDWLHFRLGFGLPIVILWSFQPLVAQAGQWLAHAQIGFSACWRGVRLHSDSKFVSSNVLTKTDASCVYKQLKENECRKKVRTDVSGADGLCDPDTYVHLSSFETSCSVKEMAPNDLLWKRCLSSCASGKKISGQADYKPWEHSARKKNRLLLAIHPCSKYGAF